jgi:hypothetical protein
MHFGGKCADPALTGRHGIGVRSLLRVDHREARADCQCGELIDGIAARRAISVSSSSSEALRHTRVPFARFRPDHRAGVELTGIDTHRCSGSGDRPRKHHATKSLAGNGTTTG